MPHGVDANMFKPLPKEEIMKIREQVFGKENKDKFVVFYNSRNARRKMTSDVVKVFKMFLDEVGDKGVLFMQTDPRDHEGANLLDVAKMLNMKPHQLMFSPQRLPTEEITKFYAMADITMNISNNEGFGLSCLESLYCGTPVIINKTGGLQDQPINDQGKVFGVMVEPSTRSLTGSQDIPFILDDRCSDKDLVTALKLMYNMTFDQRKQLGLEAREWVTQAFSLKTLVDRWDHHITRLVEQYRQSGNPSRIKIKKVT
jgi:glycosyltransferase involved in cell wall biosynthesis